MTINYALAALSGKRNPYPGKLGVVEQGVLADLILVDGNPLGNINVVAELGTNFLVQGLGLSLDWDIDNTAPKQSGKTLPVHGRLMAWPL